MNFITHSLLPVAFKQAADLKSSKVKKYNIYWREWTLIGIFGTLPDLLDFHITVYERWTSWTHVWPMTTATLAASFILWLILPKRFGRLAAWCGLAYALHIPCDIISGGLDFFLNDNVIGGWWISFLFWPLIDIGLLIIFTIFSIKIRTKAKTGAQYTISLTNSSKSLKNDP